MLTRDSRAPSAQVRTLLCCAVVAACTLFATTAFAQSASTAANAAQVEELNEVVVTGTSIRGVAPTGSELVTVTEHDIETTSAASVNDIFHQIPSLSGLNGTPPIRSDPMNTINLPSIHGLPGTGLVLVLFDGYRGVGAGILSNSPDPSSIPASALERVEVVPDGASAIYGSDAVTGVINLVLRKNFDGLEVNARYGFASQYDHSDASMVWGHSWEGGNVMIAYEYEGNSELYGSQRSQFYHLNQTNDQEANGTPGFDWRDTGCDPGTIYVTNPSTITMANPSGTPTAFPLSSTRQLGAAGPANKCDNSGYNSLIPREWRNDAVVNAHQELSDTLELWGQAFFADHDAEKDVVQGEATDFTIPNTNPYFQLPAAFTPAGGYNGAPITSVGFDYGLENIVGVPLRDDLNFKTYTGRAGLTWKFGSDWEGKFVGNFGHEEDFFINRFTNFANYQTALDGTTLNTAFNPFGPNTSYVVNSLQDYLYNAYLVVQNLSEGLVSFDGSLFHIAGGDVKLSVGGSYRRETYDGLATSGERDTGATTLADHAINARTDASEYAELYVPVFGKANALPGLQRLEFSLAGRHDQYNDFGGTTNPKIGFNWSPIGGFQIHGNYSTSFHAPNLADDTVPSIDSHAQAFCCIFPPPGSPPGTPGLYTIILNGGSKNISPEKAKNYSVGFDETLPAVPGLKFGLNYFHSAFSNQIGYLPPPFLYSGGAAAKFYTVYPTLAQEQAFIAGYPLQVSSINGGNLPGLLLDLRRQNIGAVNFGGFDFNASFSRRLFGGQAAITVGGTSLTLYEAQGVQGSGSFLNELGTGTDPKWQGRGGINWMNDVFDGALYVNYTGAYLYYANNIYHPVRDYKPVSLHFGITPFKERVLKKVQFTLDIDNVFNEDPPYVDEGVQGDNAANGFDKQEANPIGRLITVGVRAAL
jgi:iron complex outermembrane receptor protein